MEALFGTMAKNHRKKPMIDSGERRKSDATASPNRLPVVTQRKSDTSVDLQILLPLPPPPGSPWRAAAAASVSVSPNSPLVGAGTSSRKLQANAKMTNGLSHMLMAEKREIRLSEKSPETEVPKTVDRNRTISPDSIGSEFDMMEALFGTLAINRKNSPVAARRPEPPPTTTPPPAQLPSPIRSPLPLPATTIGSSACEAKLSLTVPPPPPPPRNLSAECADLPMKVSSSTSSLPSPNENKSNAASPPPTNNCDECADLPEEVSSSTSSSPSQIEITSTATSPLPTPPAKQSTSLSTTTKLPPMVKRGAGLVREAPPPPPLNMPLPRSPGQRKSPAAFGKAENATPEKKPETEEAELTKLKPLLWDKVPARANHSMVWDAIGAGSPHFDYQLMESLFGTMATNRKKIPSPPAAEDVRNRSPAQTFLLDQRKSQNISIVLGSIGITRENAVDYLLNPKSTTPPLDIVEKLNRIAPSDAEQDLIRSYPAGSTSHLAEAESFLHHLLSAVPDAFRRIDSLVFRSRYELEIQTLCQNLKTLDEACKELKKGGLFIKILEVILKVGNAMNSGTALGNAKAFNLASLRRISEVKSTDGKTTLLHFVVQEVVRREGRRRSLYQDPHPRIATAGDEEREYIMLGLPILSSLSSEFSNVKAAAGIRYDSVAGCCGLLREQESRTREFVGGVEEGEFREEMEVFSKAAEKEMKEMEEEMKRVVETVKRTTAYYHAGSKDRAAGVNRFEVFVIVKDFLGMVDGVCVELEKSTRSEIKESRSLESYMRMPTMRFSLKNSVSASSSTTESDEDF